MLKIVIALIALVYVGKALGFLLITQHVLFLKIARRIYWFMPYLTIKLITYYIFDLIKNGEYKKIVPTIVMKNKMIIVGMAMVSAAMEYAQSHPKISAKQAITCFKYIKRERLLSTYTGYVAQYAA